MEDLQQLLNTAAVNPSPANENRVRLALARIAVSGTRAEVMNALIGVVRQSQRRPFAPGRG